MPNYNSLSECLAAKGLASSISNSHSHKSSCYKTTFEQVAVGIAHANLQGQILQTNQRFCDLLRKTHSELWHQSLITLLVSAEQQQPYQKQIQRLLQGTISSFSYDVSYVHPQEGVLWRNLSVSLAMHPVGEPDYLMIVMVDIGKRKQLEAKLRDSEEQMRVIFESIRDLLLVCTVDGDEIIDINIAPTSPDYEDFSPVIDATLQYLWANDTDSIQRNGLQQAITSGETVDVEYSLCLNHELRWFMASVSPITGNTVLVVARNISDRKQAELALFAEKELAQVTLHSIGDGVVTTDVQGKITNLNPVAEDITGWKTAEAQGKDIDQIFNIVHEKTREPVINPIHQAISSENIVNMAKHTLLIARDGVEYAIEDSAAPIRNRQGQVIGAIMVFHDATDSRKLARQLSWQASHDPLTQLINRRKFDSILHSVCQPNLSKSSQHILCFLDLDQFKIINDTCGHAAGDELLCQVSQLLQTNIRASDTLARFGGDEFAILLDQCPVEQGIKIANNLCNLVQEFRFHWGEKIFSIGVSIGLVKLDQHCPSVEDALRVADAACYAAKENGRNRVQFYEINDSALLKQRGQQQWGVRIEQALATNRLCLFGQTIVPTGINPSISNQRVCEILLRMIDVENNIIPAGVFIPAAERFNLVTKIDRWVIQQFLKEYKRLRLDQSSHPGSNTLYMINLSGASIGDDKFLHFLTSQLLTEPEAAKHICFEITETAAISNLEQAMHFIQELKQLGCQFALDDFGSGMSSFGYLKALPVDYLKIDGSFIQEMADDTPTHAIVEAINNVGHIMGMKTIAEYVQSISVRNQLQVLGVDYVQGFGISHPKALADCFS